MGFDHHREDWEARFEAMAEYADYARKRDKENALTGRGNESRESPSLQRPRPASASKHGGRVGELADSGSAPRRVSEPERGPPQYRCSADDIDESGGTA